MPIAQGHIIIVQEQRFRLATVDGRALLLTLSANAAVSHEDLARLAENGALVRVTFTGDPNTDSAAVRSVAFVR
ncbi:MAG TPA: hypothetical protein VGA61_14570 [Anaerolineae bacterium]